MVGKLTDDRVASASRVPGILGKSPWSTPNEELQFSLDAIDDKPHGWSGSEAADWGNRLETAILIEGSKRLGLGNVETEFERAVIHDKIPLQASLDGLGEGDGRVITAAKTSIDGIYVVGADEIKLEGIGVLEAKLTRDRPESEPALHRGPIQLQAQMMCLPRAVRWGAIMVLYGGVELRIFLYPPHPGTMTAIKDAVLDFDRRIREKDYYPLSSSKDGNVVYPYAEKAPAIELPDEMAAVISERRLATAVIDESKAVIDACDVALKQCLGNHERGTLAQWEVSWPMRTYKAQPAKTTPAKEARTIRQSTLKIKELKT